MHTHIPYREMKVVCKQVLNGVHYIYTQIYKEKSYYTIQYTLFKLRLVYKTQKNIVK